MNYLNVYYARLNHDGHTTGERIRKGGIRSFERWKAESPFTVNVLSVERGLYFDGIIEENKDKEYKKIMFLHVALDIPIVVGDIMNWQVEDGTIEKWLIIQEEKKTNPGYRTFQIIKCNYLIKWIDSFGHLQQSWSYVLSSVDDKIKGNYRTWHNMISPQPNKYAEIIMPYHSIDRGTNFIIEDEAWKMIESDFTSVKGILYMSLTENKVNFIYDNLKDDIADTDRLAEYRIDAPATQQIFTVGSQIEPVYTLMKSGLPCDEEINLISSNPKIAKDIDGHLVAIAAGDVELTIQLKRFPFIEKTINITVGDTVQEFSAYISGPDTIRLDRYNTYKLVGIGALIDEVIFEIPDENQEYAVISKVENDECVVHANNKNKLGTLTLHALYNNIDYTKEIKVIPLW